MVFLCMKLVPVRHFQLELWVAYLFRKNGGREVKCISEWYSPLLKVCSRYSHKVYFGGDIVNSVG